MTQSSLYKNLSYSPVELAFGTSGLRGLATDMTDLECYIDTQGFIDFVLETGNIKPGSAIALAGDLRPSTPRITLAVAKGVLDSGLSLINLGEIPIPAAAYYGLQHDMPVAVITGSHIPDDRNGIKFYKRGGEVLKSDEAPIKASVAKVRKKLYSQSFRKSEFNSDGSLHQKVILPEAIGDGAKEFLNRYTSVFNNRPLANKQIIVYQHSSVAADMLIDLLETLGAEPIPVDRSDKFIPIDTENITPQNQAYFKSLAKKYPHNFAIISADGDSDRPFVVDETGIFHRGDVLGVITAEFLKAKSAAVPVSASDAVDSHLKQLGITLVHTKIGSPYVINAMEELAADGNTPAVGWEVNGGFLTGSEIKINGKTLSSLPTRDAFLPIVCALTAASEKKCKLSELFSALPQRFTQAGLLDNFPTDTSQTILKRYSDDTSRNYRDLEEYFSKSDSFGRVVNINSLDGIRITFSNGEIAHIRPSGNAPQLRIYSVAESQERADKIVALTLAEPGGVLRRLEHSVKPG